MELNAEEIAGEILFILGQPPDWINDEDYLCEIKQSTCIAEQIIATLWGLE